MTDQVAAYRAALTEKWQRDAATDSAHDLAHVDRVWRNVQRIADDNVSWPILTAATWFHDAVNLPKTSPNRAQASRMSADWAAEWLAKDGMGASDIGAVHHAIAAHSFSANIPPETPEARVLRDADRLDALGAIGLARTFAVAGQTGRALVHPGDPFATARNHDDSAFAIDHFYLKLLRLETDMLTPEGRIEARVRTERMRDYLRWLADELGQDPLAFD